MGWWQASGPTLYTISREARTHRGAQKWKRTPRKLLDDFAAVAEADLRDEMSVSRRRGQQISPLSVSFGGIGDPRTPRPRPRGARLGPRPHRARFHVLEMVLGSEHLR